MNDFWNWVEKNPGLAVFFGTMLLSSALESLLLFGCALLALAAAGGLLERGKNSRAVVVSIMVYVLALIISIGMQVAISILLPTL